MHPRAVRITPTIDTHRADGVMNRCRPYRSHDSRGWLMSSPVIGCGDYYTCCRVNMGFAGRREVGEPDGPKRGALSTAVLSPEGLNPC